MSNLYFGITRYRYDICSEISDMACFSLNLKTAVDFNAEARCASNEVVWLPERSEPEGPQGDARRKGVTQRGRDENLNVANVQCFRNRPTD